MDTLDTRIFRELVQDRAAFASSDIRKSFKAVAKKLGFDEVTVRKRASKMQKTGFLQYWMVMINPTTLGLRLAQLSFNVPSETDKHGLIEQLKLLPGAFVLVDCFGSSLYYAFLYRDESSLQKQIELVRMMSKSADLVYSPTPIPECKMALTQTDWDIARALQKNPRKSYGAIASDLGISTRTIERRLRRMVDGRAVFILPSMNPAALEGVIQADLLVLYDDINKKSEIDQKIMTLWDDYVARGEFRAKESSFFNLFVKNVSQTQEVLDWVKGQPGVKSCRIDLVQDRIELYTSLNAEVENRIQASIVTRTKAARRSES